MNTDLTKEQLDRLENDLNYDTSDDPRVTRLVSMARRTLQAEERLGRALEALKEMTSGNMRCGYCDSGFDTIEAYAQAAVDGIEDSPKDLPPPLPCAPPAHSDVQP